MEEVLAPQWEPAGGAGASGGGLPLTRSPSSSQHASGHAPGAHLILPHVLNTDVRAAARTGTRHPSDAAAAAASSAAAQPQALGGSAPHSTGGLASSAGGVRASLASGACLAREDGHGQLTVSQWGGPTVEELQRRREQQLLRAKMFSFAER